MNDKVSEATAALEEPAEGADVDLTTIPPDEISEAITEEELARLTPEERAALEGSVEDIDEDDGEGDAPDDPDAAALEQAKQDDPVTAAEPQPKAAAIGDDVVAAYPDYDPAEIVKKAADLKAEMKTLRARFDDGEITEAEFDTEVERVTDAIADTKADQRAAAAAVKDFNDKFTAAVTSFAADNAELWTDDHAEGFQREVRDIMIDPSFDKMGLRARLSLARERYAVTAKAIGKPLTSTAPKAEDQTPVKKPKPVKSAIGDIPHTLARVPAAASLATQDGKFGQIQAMFDDPKSTPADLERALSRLSPQEQEAFASMDL